MLHQVMAEIKDYFEETCSNANFANYYALNVEPGQIHKSKMEHKHAIFVLGREIAESMKDMEFSASGRIAARMRELAAKTGKEIECNY